MPAEVVSPLEFLHPRRVLTAEQIALLIEDMKHALQGASAENYFRRMELNHDTRFAWWAGQSDDGLKWSTPNGGRLRPGEVPVEVFPWEGASDTRVRLVEMVIREHNRLKRLALQRKQQQVGPRNLSPEDDPQAKAALWGQVAEYYEDITARELRTAMAQWPDITHEYGSGYLYAGWKSETRLAKRTLSMEQVKAAITAAALEAAQMMTRQLWESEGGDTEQAPELDAEQQHLITLDASVKLQELIEDPKQNAVLALQLQRMDEEMPLDEAKRLAKALTWDGTEPVSYYAVELANQRPDFRALTYGVNFFFNPSAGRMKDCGWAAMEEWVSVVDLENRANNPHEPYDEAWIAKVKQHKGKRAFDFSEFMRGTSQSSWLLAGGRVRSKLADTEQDAARAGMVQILHVYHIANTIGSAKAVYHTVLSGHVLDSAGLSQCCEHAEGRLPFFEHLNDIEALTMLDSEGYGEKSCTDQMEVKIQRDLRADDASMKIKPPLQVPASYTGTRVPLMPGVQIPTMMTAGMGKIEPLLTGARSNEMVALEQSTRDSFDEFWARGMKVDPVTKQTASQVLVSDFLMDVGAVKEWVFKLIQQFSPPELRAGFVNGLPVDIMMDRKEIQGAVGVNLDFDVADLDGNAVEKKLKSLPAVLSLNTKGELNTAPFLKSVTASLFPASYRLLIEDSDKRAKEETEDEQTIVSKILSGTLFDEESSYVPAVNHDLRLQVMQRIFGAQVNKQGGIVQMQPMGLEGQPSRAQKVFMEDATVKALVENRFAFHARQIQQMQDNAQTGRQLVQPVADEIATA